MQRLNQLHHSASALFWVGVVTLFVLVCMPTTLSADTVVLKNGSRIDGMVISESESVVVLKVGDLGTLKLEKSRVVSIEKNLRSGDRPAKPKREKKSRVEKVGLEESARPKPTNLPAKLSRSLKNHIESPLLPFAVKELEAVKALVLDLQRQRATYRTRAERQLSGFGVQIVPHLQKMARSQFVRARICALRLLNEFPRYESMPVALSGLQDQDPWIRKLSSELAGKISGNAQSYPWQADKDQPQRKRKATVWRVWYQQQEILRQKLESRPEGSDNAPEGRKN